jgi:hypothetical protein
MNPTLLSPAGRARARAEWEASRGRPFSHVLLPSAFDAPLLRAAHAELAAQPFRQLSNDLYTFEQTRELRAAPGGALARLTASMYAPEFREWLCGVTGVALDATVDLSAARYGAGSHLLCHDDDLSERRIAFVIYLVPEGDICGGGGGSGGGWDVGRDGGALELFDTAPSVAAALGGDPAKLALAPPAAAAGSGGPCLLPGRVVKRLAPEFNALALFEVSAASHHAVAEVTAATQSRLSISGWLHGPPLARPPLPPLPTPALAEPLDELLPPAPAARAPPPAKRPRAAAPPPPPPAVAAVAPIAPLLSSVYCRMSVLRTAQARFADEASLLLTGLLAPAVLGAARDDLARQRWLRCGPANMRNYRTAAGLCWPSCAPLAAAASAGDGGGLRGLFRQLLSSEFRAFLGHVTGLRLGACAGEVRAFARGEYTLLFDEDHRKARVEAKRRAVLPEAAAAAAEPAAATATKPAAKPASRGAAADEPAAAAAAAAASADERWLRAQLQPLPAGAAVLDVCLCLTDPAADARWAASAAAGGSVVFLTADEELLTVPPVANSLSLVLRDASIMSFVKHVSAAAPGTRYDVALTFAVLD